ncbi:MAG: tetratricopeptide repeat protein [Candidatus Aminicenantes bacterium]|nr:tetratricopeptide repeat protein [Candidatus Aminicenantes bacterium]NIM84404.1 tetratricopeptide repeat protein [Candidatus Aminicenantes bacterium]NIN23891.1 tetratricopeptide repeat protein [Candidatus Aminicenantes bacterium]NIN47607.1 tetratricopeptide repeat protein [Candidatus Aminicenantes bacterium]NIN90527.1 tetratricopeptide repeat protein [Candidatus Aminicenantes bacterium]
MEKIYLSNSTNPCEELIYNCIEGIASKKMVIFCGAGISMHSGLPLANDFVLDVLKKMDVSKQDSEILLNANLPFESFMEVLIQDNYTSSFFDIFDIGEPNTNHLLIAKLAKLGYLKTICTTNFDRLIEVALDREGMIRGQDYKVFYEENHFARIDWDDGDYLHLIKIHGSIEDKGSMAVTLHRVASRAYSSNKNKIIEYIFSEGPHKSVVIMGYSCSDLFDISPAIQSLSKKHKDVYFIEHILLTGNRDGGWAEDIAIKDCKNPFQHFSGSNRIFYDTDELMKKIWISCIDEEYKFISKYGTQSWKKFLDKALEEAEERYTKTYKHSVIGSIFSSISYFDIATKYFEKALNVAREIGDLKQIGNCLGDIGVSYFHLGDFIKALMYYLEAVQAAEAIGDKRAKSKQLCNLSIAQQSVGEFQMSLNYSMAALKICRELGDEQGEEANIGNIVNSFMELGEYKSAISCAEKALDISRKIGNKEGETNHLSAIGNAYRNLGDYEKAMQYLEDALAVAKKIGYQKGIGLCLGNIGNVHKSSGNLEMAQGFYREALFIVKPLLGDKSYYTLMIENNIKNISE